MADTRRMPGHLDVGDQQVLSSPDVARALLRSPWLQIRVTENVAEF